MLHARREVKGARIRRVFHAGRNELVFGPPLVTHVREPDKIEYVRIVKAQTPRRHDDCCCLGYERPVGEREIFDGHLSQVH